jgi:oligoribonuclease NrnB/cAMP/cGMP phosphodiesterase (DHH superfamily)
MRDIETISNISTIRVKVFTHNDLDGVSCGLVFKKFYNTKNINFNYDFISYNDYDKIKEFFDIDNEYGAKIYDYLFITDLNFKGKDLEDYILNPFKKFTTLLNSPNKGYSSIFKKIFFIDHHADSEKTFRDKIFTLFDKIEYFNDMTNCASLQLYNFCANRQSIEWTNTTLGLEHAKLNDQKAWLESYLKNVNDWDTFEWKNNNNLMARDLNLLFSHMQRTKFFLMQVQKESIVFSFNKTEKTIINETLESINKEYNRVLNTSIVLDHIDEDGFTHPDIQYIIIRSDDNVSLICDMLKNDIINKKIYTRFNIKYIINVSFKYGSINFRRVYDDIDLTKIASIYGGGGHPFASGCVLDGKNQLQLKRILLPTLERYANN